MKRTKLPVVSSSDIDRRDAMKLLAAGAALASGVGCMSKPKERIMPRVEQPPEMTPGIPLVYATSMVLDGYATGLLVKTHEARPTKLEGNPDHPASLGGTTPLHQASVLELYDPDRPRAPIRSDLPVLRDRLLREIAARERIPNLWFLMHPQSSPLVAEQIAKIRQRHPGARFAFHSPVDRRPVFEGAQRAFGRPLEIQYHFDRADVVVSLDADFMAAMPNSTRWARDFATRRRPQWPLTDMLRLYVAEPKPTPTGSLADHRLAARPSRILQLAHALATGNVAELDEAERDWVNRVLADLRAHRGRALVVVGDRQPAHVHEIVHAINQTIGAPIDLTEPAILEPLGDGIDELSRALFAREVGTLVIIEANPVYTAALPVRNAKETFCIASARHETARQCGVFMPLAHYLESWDLARAYDGTLSFVQPVIRPMYDSVGLVEALAAFAGDPHASAHEMLRARYAADWNRLLQLGMVPDTAARPVTGLRAVTPAPVERVASPAIELAFETSHAVYDGRFANVSWLQELPKPIDKVTWGNVATLSPATARRLGVETGAVVSIGVAELPVYVLPGHADDCVSVEIGYGRTAAGHVGNGVGASVYPLRGPLPPLVEPTTKRASIAATQTHFSQHDREIAFSTTLARYQAEPNFTASHRGPQTSMLPAQFANEPAWGMTIDTAICTGCSACVVACVAENNIPVVGKSGVIANREMHWLRIDTYRDDAGEVVHQPMLCQHCEDAPCEYVCPTYATQHSPDGLNEMVYNRCVGTRFCSNNCPYKVRRFNWFDYTEDTPKTERLQRNPNVTVRSRGVMEKCTFCVQRIRGAEIDARKERREIRPGEVMTACQQACPTGAIQFGSLSHENTPLVQLRKQPRAYFVLHELGTRPRTAYLAKIKNE